MSMPPPNSPAPPQWHWHIAETYRGLVTLSVEALKILGLINGGAAVALLAYAGNNRLGAPPSEFKPALFWYCGGVVAIALAFVVAYLTQLRLYTEERLKVSGVNVPERHSIGIAVAVVLALGAAATFVFGCLSTAAVLARH